jgi:hypothetical protein
MGSGNSKAKKEAPEEKLVKMQTIADNEETLKPSHFSEVLDLEEEEKASPIKRIAQEKPPKRNSVVRPPPTNAPITTQFQVRKSHRVNIIPNTDIDELEECNLEESVNNVTFSITKNKFLKIKIAQSFPTTGYCQTTNTVRSSTKQTNKYKYNAIA